MRNRLKKLSPQFQNILKRCSSLGKPLGFDIYLVGGVVRDLILGKAVFDLDIVVEGDAIKLAKALADSLKKVSENQQKTDFSRHHAFGTATVSVGLHKIDFATARSEKYSHWGALPKIQPNLLAKDLLRRDFTINAMAISLNKGSFGKLIDLHNGSQDLKKGLIRVLHEVSFLDDPTRILRAIRFEQRFSFKIEAETFKLLKEALACNALQFVNPHRLRDELILILKEPNPYRYIKRIKELEGFSFIDKKIRLNKQDFGFFLRAERVVKRYQKKFRKHRLLQIWTMYLAAILSKLSARQIAKIIHDFGFKKGERIIINSIKTGTPKIKRLDRKLKAHVIYRTLNPYSFESVLFFYAYHNKNKLRKNIEYFLDELVNIRLKTKGRDLQKLKLQPQTLYNKILQRLLYVKIDKGLKTKKEELDEAKRIFEKLCKTKS
jgi:tRNA nucleotidyltransferase (CCA-adding enzyme)